MVLVFNYPQEVTVARGPDGMRFLGHAEAISETLTTLLETLADPTVERLQVAEWYLEAREEEVPGVPKANEILYPFTVWRTACDILTQVAIGLYPSPFDFGDAHYYDRSGADIGISLLGVVRYDWQFSSLTISKDELRLISVTEAQLSRRNVAILVRRSYGYQWAVDLVDPSSGDIAESNYVVAATIEDTMNACIERSNGDS